ncbi:hypothetical protein JB92DRAFT_2838918 [Gautieria morchelliformis]|nr:hypothetical protein JB92DRAFT_2838918 [Gautieria morchelliformis]
MCVSSSATTTQFCASQNTSVVQLCCGVKSGRWTCGSTSGVWTQGYGGPEAAVAKRLVYRMGMGVGSHMYQKYELWLGRKDIWKICGHAVQQLAPLWINAPRARASTRVGWIRGCWVRVESVERWECCDVSCGRVWAWVDVGGASGSVCETWGSVYAVVGWVVMVVMAY